ncbi:hypothetical protein CPC08DRAFT_767675 [Agrocybe pediades]|nr:hypothetical protein CPC08DRAFT_767675 [Agrocybe pediades]
MNDCTINNATTSSPASRYMVSPTEALGLSNGLAVIGPPTVERCRFLHAIVFGGLHSTSCGSWPGPGP